MRGPYPRNTVSEQPHHNRSEDARYSRVRLRGYLLTGLSMGWLTAQCDVGERPVAEARRHRSFFIPATIARKTVPQRRKLLGPGSGTSQRARRGCRQHRSGTLWSRSGGSRRARSGEWVHQDRVVLPVDQRRSHRVPGHRRPNGRGVSPATGFSGASNTLKLSTDVFDAPVPLCDHAPLPQMSMQLFLPVLRHP
jgi:hypothetical protein